MINTAVFTMPIGPINPGAPLNFKFLPLHPSIRWVTTFSVSLMINVKIGAASTNNQFNFSNTLQSSPLKLNQNGCKRSVGIFLKVSVSQVQGPDLSGFSCAGNCMIERGVAGIPRSLLRVHPKSEVSLWIAMDWTGTG